MFVSGIDGFSRLVTALGCRPDNTAQTALSVFNLGVQKYGIPSRVRGDKGSENRGIAQFMIEERGTGRGSFIAGPSTHNQRIERLWRDVFRVVLKMFYSCFYWLEENGHLDSTDGLHLFALHYTFLPRINEALEQFVTGWNNHPVRTERNWSPQQMFINSRLAEGHNIEDFPANYDWYGRDWEGPIALEEETVVEIIETENPLSEDKYSELQTLIPNPQQECDDFGLGMFIQCKDFVVNSCSE